MTAARSHARLLVAATLPVVSLGAALGGWWLAAGRPAGPGAHLALSAAAIGLAVVLAQRVDHRHRPPFESETAGDGPPLHDSDDAVRRAGGRDAVARELFAMLQRHLPEALEDLAAARAAADPSRLRGTAHRLKGAAAYCGVPRLRADLERLEAAVDAEADTDAALDRLLATIEALRTLEPAPPELPASPGRNG